MMQSQEPTTQTQCITCGHSHTGKYCAQCGEKVINEKDKRVFVFLEEFFHLLFHADSKLLKSLKYLLVKPGQLSKDYLSGKRKIYTSPLTLFFIGNLIYYLISPIDIVSSRFISQTQGQVYSASIIEKAEQKRVAKKWTPSEMEQHYNEECTHVSKMMLILLIFLFSLPLSLLYFGKNRYYYDHVVFATEIVSYLIYTLFLLLPFLLLVVFYTLAYVFKIVLPLEHIVNSMWSIFILLLIVWIWVARAAKNIYGQRWLLTLSKTLVVSLSSVLIIIFYRYILFYVTLAML
jgi:hypothetical protein